MNKIVPILCLLLSGSVNAQVVYGPALIQQRTASGDKQYQIKPDPGKALGFGPDGRLTTVIARGVAGIDYIPVTGVPSIGMVPVATSATTATWQTIAAGGGTDATITFSDITTNNASTSKHGFLPKLDGNALHHLDGSGAYTAQDVWSISISDESTPLTTGINKATFRAPRASTITGVRFSVNNASSSGLPTIDIKKNGVSIFSTLLSIDANEKTSVTAATPAVISTSSVADDDEITIDQTVSGTGATGGKVYIYVSY